MCWAAHRGLSRLKEVMAYMVYLFTIKPEGEPDISVVFDAEAFGENLPKQGKTDFHHHLMDTATEGLRERNVSFTVEYNGIIDMEALVKQQDENRG
jgi:hypothetical protein